MLGLDLLLVGEVDHWPVLLRLERRRDEARGAVDLSGDDDLATLRGLVDGLDVEEAPPLEVVLAPLGVDPFLAVQVGVDLIAVDGVDRGLVDHALDERLVDDRHARERLRRARLLEERVRVVLRVPREGRAQPFGAEQPNRPPGATVDPIGLAVEAKQREEPTRLVGARRLHELIDHTGERGDVEAVAEGGREVDPDEGQTLDHVRGDLVDLLDVVVLHGPAGEHLVVLDVGHRDHAVVGEGEAHQAREVLHGALAARDVVLDLVDGAGDHLDLQPIGHDRLREPLHTLAGLHDVPLLLPPVTLLAAVAAVRGHERSGELRLLLLGELLGSLEGRRERGGLVARHGACFLPACGDKGSLFIKHEVVRKERTIYVTEPLRHVKT